MGIYKLRAYEKQAIWGGTKLNKEYGKKGYEEIAETWELSAISGKESRVDGGEYDGKTLDQLLDELGREETLGTRASAKTEVPLLIKFIDAAAPLSVQVHPDAKTAKLIGGGAASKTEMWVICEAEPDAFLYFGLTHDMSREEFSETLKNGTLTEHLNKVPVKKGDVFFIPSGTIHAIGAGITICEIQQTSDTTYRLYDHGRTDKDGRPRQLHISEGTLSASLKALGSFYEIPKELDDGGELLYSCEFFTVYRRYGDRAFFVDKDSFSALTVIEGEGSVSSGCSELAVHRGDTVFIPAKSGEIHLRGSGLVCIDSRL